MMGDVIIFNDESIDFIWNTIQNQQIIFHPEIAPEGKIKYDISLWIILRTGYATELSLILVVNLKYIFKN